MNREPKWRGPAFWRHNFTNTEFFSFFPNTLNILMRINKFFLRRHKNGCIRNWTKHGSMKKSKLEPVNFSFGSNVGKKDSNSLDRTEPTMITTNSTTPIPESTIALSIAPLLASNTLLPGEKIDDKKASIFVSYS